MTPVRMVVTDLDGTLLRSDKTISDETARVFAALREKGILTAFATARPERTMATFRARIRPDYVICNNGACISDQNGEIYRDFIPVETAKTLAARLRAHPLVEGVTAETGRRMLHTFESGSWPHEWQAVYTPDIVGSLTHDMPKMSAFCARETGLEEIAAEFPELRFHTAAMEPWRQITRRSADKMAAILHLCGLLDIAPREVAAFGDDDNDAGMLRGCGMGVAMKGASGSAREAARYSCPTCDEEGVAGWIRTHILD